MLLICIVTLIPVLLSSPELSFLSFGQIAGLMGITLFSINLLMSSRIKFLENLFGGLNQIYRTHHLIGGFSFILMMVHPVLLAFSRLEVSFDYAKSLVTIGNDFAIDLGITSLLLIMGLLLITFYTKLPYQIWRFTHKLTGVVFIIAVFHSFLVPSTISDNPILWWYMFLISAIGILAYLYRTVFFRFLVKRYKYEVTKVTKLKPNIVEVTLMPETESKISYHSGQFVFISFSSKTVSEEIHPFSIASYDNEKIVVISKIEGDYTEKLMNLEVGTKALIEGAFGRFSYKFFPSTNQIWIAGGIGIVPFIGMVKDMSNEAGFNVDLYYCIKEEKDVLNFPTDKVNLKVFTSKTMGHITAEYVSKNSKVFKSSTFFICGPSGFMKDLRKQLVELGIRNSKIHTEEFSLE